MLIVCRKQYKSKIGAGGSSFFSGQSLISPRNDLSASYDGAVFFSKLPTSSEKFGALGSERRPGTKTQQAVVL